MNTSRLRSQEFYCFALLNFLSVDPHRESMDHKYAEKKGIITRQRRLGTTIPAYEMWMRGALKCICGRSFLHEHSTSPHWALLLTRLEQLPCVNTPMGF